MYQNPFKYSFREGKAAENGNYSILRVQAVILIPPYKGSDARRQRRQEEKPKQGKKFETVLKEAEATHSYYA